MSIINTYAWIHDTANSRIDRTIIEGNTIRKLKFNKGIEPRRFINKWPAIIFALRRILKVRGRIKFLIISIINIKLIKTVGVPVGIEWKIIVFLCLNHPNNIIDNHQIRAVGKEIIIWALTVKL